MKKIAIYILILLTNCSNKEQNESSNGHQGYIILMHKGDTDRAISPYTLILEGDTTYLQYKNTINTTFYDFRYGLGYAKYNLDTLNYQQFIDISSIFSKYLQFNRAKTDAYGIFQVVIVDKNRQDSLSFLMQDNDSTTIYLRKVIDWAEQEKKIRIYDRFSYYLNLQESK